MKNLFIRFGFLAILLFLMSSCGHKSTTPKRLDIPTGVVSVDTVAHPSEAIQCHVHVEFAYLKGNKYAVANDFYSQTISLLIMISLRLKKPSLRL